jgi:hypothetical protein
METRIKAKFTPEKAANTNKIMPKIKKRGLGGAWKGKITIIGDIDNVFNLAL